MKLDFTNIGIENIINLNSITILELIRQKSFWEWSFLGTTEHKNNNGSPQTDDITFIFFFGIGLKLFIINGNKLYSRKGNFYLSEILNNIVHTLGRQTKSFLKNKTGDALLSWMFPIFSYRVALVYEFNPH